MLKYPQCVKDPTARPSPCPANDGAASWIGRRVNRLFPPPRGARRYTGGVSDPARISPFPGLSPLPLQPRGGTPAEEPWGRDKFTLGGDDPGGPRGWKPYAWLAGGLVATGVVVGLLNPSSGETLKLPKTTSVLMQGGKVAYIPPLQTFPVSTDWSQRELTIKVQVPADWARQQTAVVSLRVRDSEGRSQSTLWTAGQPTASNPDFDKATNTLTLRLRPSSADVDEQGGTDEGFDPSKICSLALLVSPHEKGPYSRGQLQIVEQTLRTREEKLEPARTRPLYGSVSQATSKRPGELISGVGGYFQYGDLYNWEEVKPLVERRLADQQGLPAFRWMGGLDLRERGIEPEVFPAMREFLRMSEASGQNQQIFTLLDGAIPNAKLQRAYSDVAAREQLVEELRPFIREFGNARVGGNPVMFDLVNEIHGTPGPTRAKQQLVERLVETFIEEAPGATLTVGVQNFRELRYWTYLIEQYAGQPVNFAMTFHLYEPMENVPHRRELNIPDHIPVGITEAQPHKGVEKLVGAAADKGYDWMLFWTDRGHPYDANVHRAATRQP